MSTLREVCLRSAQLLPGSCKDFSRDNEKEWGFKVKIYGVITGHNNMEFVLSQTPYLLISGMHFNKRMKKFLIKHREDIRSLIIDHGAWFRYRKNITWSYERVKRRIFEILIFLKHIRYDGEVIPIAPDRIKDQKTTIRWQQRWLKDYSGESICVYRGWYDGYNYFGITKNPKPSALVCSFLRDKGKLHGLGAKPKWMSFYKQFNFESIDCTLDSFGWNKHRISDFLKFLEELR